MKFVIAAGGTGGHLFPGLAVGEALIAAGHEVMLLVSEKEIDAIATKGLSGFRIEKIAGMGMPKLFSPAMLHFGWKFWRALCRVKELCRTFEPAAILGMGGFTSTAPILAGRSRKIPTFVHESNAIPGRANRLNAKYVSKVLLGFEECRAFFPNASSEITGTPIRNSFVNREEQSRARGALGLAPDRQTILIMGGSQGAHGINKAFLQTLPHLKGRELQFIHLTGARDEAEAKAAYEREGFDAFVAAFSSRMSEIYSASNLAIARSGAATLAELSCVKLPSILVPYPFAADDHQTANAQIFEKAGAAILIRESEISADFLGKRISDLIDHPAKLDLMSKASGKLAHLDAAQRVADIILKSAQ